MTKCQPFVRRLSVAMLPVAVMLLSGCGSGPDAAMAEKLTRAEQAAQRAETAQKAAERAARAASAKLDQINSTNEPGTAPAASAEAQGPVDPAGADAGAPDPT